MKYEKHIFTLLLLTITILGRVQAQTPPQGLSYQTVVHDTAGRPIASRIIAVRFTIRAGGPSGAMVYRETQTVTTNAFGIFSTVIGTGAGTILGPLSGVQWSSGGMFLQVEADYSGGTTYTDMGTDQLRSTPYSLYTGTALQSDADVSGVSFDSTGQVYLQTRPLLNYTNAPAWLTTGNAGLGNPNVYLGTIDNTDLILKGHNVAGLTVGTGGALLMKGSTAGYAPISGAGTRMMWMPGAQALRAGSISGAAWDSSSIGIGSIALGKDGQASGTSAISIGSDNIVTGTNASAMGTGLIAKTMNVTVVGSYNDTTGSGSATSWGASDPIFIVGNGTSASTRGNAMVVSKNGAVTLSGLIATQSISMVDTAITVTGALTVDPGAHSKINLSVSTGGGFAITLTNGRTAGQIITFEVHNSGGNGHQIKFNDDPAYNMNLNTAAASGSYTMHDTDSLTLLWDGSIWVELSHSFNN